MLMKKIILFSSIFFVSTFFYTCKKDAPIKGLTPTVIPPSSPGPDSIVYTDIADLSLISPTGSYFPCSPIPIPIDTLFSDSIDLDSDGTYDLKFIDKHYILGMSASDPCSNYHYQITVSQMSTDIKIATHSSIFYCIYGFNINDPVSSSFSYSPGLFIKGSPYMASLGSVNFVGEYYVGIQMIKGGKTMYGWVRLENTGINGIIIKDFAINKTDGNQILAGQHL